MESQGHGHGHGHGRAGGLGTDFSAAAELLDLDAEVFGAFLADVVGLVEEVIAGGSVSLIADVGCGSGTGTLALAERFPGAELIPVDAAEPLLEHLAARARDIGVGARVHPLVADLDEAWPPSLAGLDLVWASASMHHLADPPARLADVHGALTPGGVLALVEVDDPARFQPTFLTEASDEPEGVGRLEARARALLLPEMTAAMPFLQADWVGVLEEAGFRIEVDRVFDLRPGPPLPPATARYAALSMQRLRDHLRDGGQEDRLSAADRAVLEELTGDGPAAVQNRDDLQPRSRRHLWLARRL